jgi:hypothetical protein
VVVFDDDLDAAKELLAAEPVFGLAVDADVDADADDGTGTSADPA